MLRNCTGFRAARGVVATIALASAAIGVHAQEQQAPSKEEAKPYAHATRGVMEFKRPTDHFKILLDESNLGGKELELVELTLAAGVDVRRHRHGSLEVFYVLSGTLGHEVNGETHMLTPGMVGVVRAGDFVRHFVPKESDVRVLVIWAPGGEAGRLLDYSKGTPVAQE